MLSTLLRWFVYGFILFVGLWFLMYLPLGDLLTAAIREFAPIVVWGACGGVSFLVAYGSGSCLKRLLLGKKG
jgi:hypothetical protein